MKKVLCLLIILLSGFSFNSCSSDDNDISGNELVDKSDISISNVQVVYDAIELSQSKYYTKITLNVTNNSSYTISGSFFVEYPDGFRWGSYRQSIKPHETIQMWDGASISQSQKDSGYSKIEFVLD